MDNSLLNIINGFRIEFLNLYPNLIMEILEDKHDKSIMIYHNYIKEDSDDEFIETEITLLDKFFWKNRIFNVGFSFGYEFYESLKDRIIVTCNLPEPSNIIYLCDYMNEKTDKTIFMFENYESLNVAA